MSWVLLFLLLIVQGIGIFFSILAFSAWGKHRKKDEQPTMIERPLEPAKFFSNEVLYGERKFDKNGIEDCRDFIRDYITNFQNQQENTLKLPSDSTDSLTEDSHQFEVTIEDGPEEHSELHVPIMEELIVEASSEITQHPPIEDTKKRFSAFTSSPVLDELRHALLDNAEEIIPPPDIEYESLITEPILMMDEEIDIIEEEPPENKEEYYEEQSLIITLLNMIDQEVGRVEKENPFLVDNKKIELVSALKSLTKESQKDWQKIVKTLHQLFEMNGKKSKMFFLENEFSNFFIKK